MKFSARYFDGQRATAHEVTVTLWEGEISFQLQDTHLVYKKNQYFIQSALAEVTRIIELEDGGRLEVADHQVNSVTIPRLDMCLKLFMH